MSRYEKHAWFNLAVLAVTLAAFIVLLLFVGMQERSMAAFGLLGLLGFSQFFYLPRKRDSQIVSDERDQSIQLRTMLTAYTVFWVVFVGSSIAVWAIYRSEGFIPVHILPIFPLVGFMILTLVQSIMTLVQYGRGQ